MNVLASQQTLAVIFYDTFGLRSNTRSRTDIRAKFRQTCSADGVHVRPLYYMRWRHLKRYNDVLVLAVISKNRLLFKIINKCRAGFGRRRNRLPSFSVGFHKSSAISTAWDESVLFNYRWSVIRKIIFESVRKCFRNIISYIYYETISRFFVMMFRLCIIFRSNDVEKPYLKTLFCSAKI